MSSMLGLNYMTECDNIDPLNDREDAPTKARLTRPQKKAMKQILELYAAYPQKVRFTRCEVDGVTDKTLLSLIEKGYLNTELCVTNNRVRYFIYTRKKFEDTMDSQFHEFDVD